MKINATVIEGKGEGRQLGFPTANIKTSIALLYSPGVYLGETFYNTKQYHSLVVIGLVDGLEVWLADFNGDLYGQQIKVEIKEKLSEVLKIGDREQLVAKIQQDIKQAQAIWTMARPSSP
ncbi:MAG: riboflavin kinase [Candidatus Komeilibacteria bacterium]|nr:riboflavin kinase [Candidatus Komeilibacteria bacterium]